MTASILFYCFYLPRDNFFKNFSTENGKRKRKTENGKRKRKTENGKRKRKRQQKTGTETEIVFAVTNICRSQGKSFSRSQIFFAVKENLFRGNTYFSRPKKNLAVTQRERKRKSFSRNKNIFAANENLFRGIKNCFAAKGNLFFLAI